MQCVSESQRERTPFWDAVLIATNECDPPYCLIRFSPHATTPVIHVSSDTMLPDVSDAALTLVAEQTSESLLRVALLLLPRVR